MSDLDALLAAAEEDLSAGDPAAALAHLTPHASEDAAVDLLLAEAHLMQGASAAALAAARRAESARPEGDADAGWWVAEALQSNWRPTEAREVWRRLATQQWPDAWARLSLAEDLCGDPDASAFAWSQAVLGDPLHFAPWAQLTDTEFDRIVEGALARLAPKYGRFLDNCRIIGEPVPFAELCAPGEPGSVPPDLLGLFHGPTLEDQAEAVADMAVVEGLLPPTIYLFQRNLQRRFTDPAKLRVEIRTTLFHEVAHLLGLDEGEVDALGLG